MNNQEMPVQLDLEGGFVVGQKNARVPASVKDEFDDYYTNEWGDGAIKDEFHEYNYTNIPIKDEADDYDVYESLAINQKRDNEWIYRNRAVKEELDGDAYCIDQMEYKLREQDCSEDDKLQQHPLQNKVAADAPAANKFTKSNKIHARPLKFVLGPPPTLLKIATEVVSSNIEKYHPLSFAIFSECQWEEIVECRYESFAKVESSLTRNYNKLLMPPISQKVLTLIEDQPTNAHLCQSRKVDTLLWKKIVDYSYPIGGITRPAVLEEPYEILVNRLKEWGKNLLELFELEKQNKNEVRGQNVERRRSWDSACAHDKCTKRKSLSECEDSKSEETERLSGHPGSSTYKLIDMLVAIQHLPMDVKLLSETGIGKSVTKAVKIATKLEKQALKDDISEYKVHEALAIEGYPCFWKKSCVLYQIHNSNPYSQLKVAGAMASNCNSKEFSPLQLLILLLQEWKKMASENGVVISSTTNNVPPPMEKQIDSKEDEIQFSFATFGKPPNMSVHQHQANMKLLHASHNWKALYCSLQKREQMIQAACGDKVRVSRENLERKRPKIGKVALKKSVGRVKGLSSPDTIRVNCGIGATVTRGKERREAILSKSLGRRAKCSTLSNNSRSNSKLSQLRLESKAASNWLKSTQKTVSKNSHTNNTHISEARTGCYRGSAPTAKPKVIGNQARVELQGGKRMTFPAAASATSVKMFSSLQKGSSDMSVNERISFNEVRKRKR